MNLFSMALGERMWGNLSNSGSPGFRSGLPVCLGPPGLYRRRECQRDGIRVGGGLYGRVRKLAEMGWNPGQMIQIIVEMPDTWKVVMGMNGD